MEETEKERKEVLIQMNKNEKEIKNEFHLKFYKILLVVILIILIIKIFFGTIELYNPLGYPYSKARYYKTSLNDKEITNNYDLIQKIPIIPFLINLNSTYMGMSNTGSKDGTYFYADDSDKYILDISSYSCFYNNYQIECTNIKNMMKENNDTKYTNLKITRTNNPYEVMYNGKFINDITKYLERKGVYAVEVTAKYLLVETRVYFYFIR